MFSREPTGSTFSTDTFQGVPISDTELIPEPVSEFPPDVRVSPPDNIEPSPGRFVQYRTVNSDYQVALIVGVDKRAHTVNLVVFRDGPIDSRSDNVKNDQLTYWAEGVKLESKTNIYGWRWPVRS